MASRSSPQPTRVTSPVNRTFAASPEQIDDTNGSVPDRTFDVESNLEEHDPEIARLAQDYRLPAAVSASLASWTKGANSLAVILALFAGVQASLIQVVVQTEGLPGGDTTKALKWFMYAGVFVDLGGAASAVAIVNMAATASIIARSRAITDPRSLPRHVLKGGYIDDYDPTLLNEDRETHLLQSFGLSRRFEWIGLHMLFSFVIGSLFLVISLCIWIYLTEPTAIFASLVPLVPLTLFPTFFVLIPDFNVVYG